MARKVFCALLLGMMATAAMADAHGLFPMEQGDYFVFEATHPSGMETLERFDVVENYYGWRRWNGHPFGAGWFITTDRWFVKWVGRAEGLIDADAQLYDHWPVETPDPCLGANSDISLQRTGFTLQTRAGTFQDCQSYEVAGTCADAGLSTLTVAPGVGIVRYTESTIAGPVVHELIEASVGGVQYPLPAPRFHVAGATDKAVYTHYQLPSGQVSVAEIAVELTVGNDSTEDLPVRFSGNYRYDFTLAPLNDPDNPVTTWSHGKAFTKNLVFTDLAAGDELTYRDVLPARDDNGVLLPAGLYVLRGWWTAASNTPTLSAVDFGFELTIEIQGPTAPPQIRPFVPAPQDFTADELFRLEGNSEWVYEVRPSIGAIGEHTMRTTSQYGAWFTMTGSPFGDGWFRNYTNASGDVSWAVQWTGHMEGIVDANAAQNASWPIAALDACLQSADVTLVDKSYVLQTAAGRFVHCHVYDVVGNCSDAGLSRFVLAPGFGLVQFFTHSIAGPVEHVVKRMNLDGAIYPKPAGLRVEMTAEVNGGVDSHLRIVNNSGTNITVTSPTSITWDLALIDPVTGDDLNRLHWMMLGLMVLTPTDILPGQPVDITGSLAFEDASGNALDEARVRHELLGDRRFSGEVVLRR